MTLTTNQIELIRPDYDELVKEVGATGLDMTFTEFVFEVEVEMED